MGVTRTHRYGALGLATLTLITLFGHVSLAWGLRELLTPGLIIRGGLAAGLVLAGGMALGRAITSGRPQGERLIAVAAGAAIGGVCSFFGATFSIWSLMLDNL
ncbi:hypothetical protein HD597_010033 [Nonomuraea thailandensis]|uniref:Uncharacterized protein n=1 Tax=Nonomuraea thailandensis TaxID=1188745 RepID=A0A9X2GZ07_9ACTN|nr:hypothetical protein [Nonomuraea thailandensis]MCP2363013.1 hypothetical protein [Nonomuraea thailandensis]